MTAVTPYRSRVAPARAPGFRSLLLAEWTKLRTVRGFLVALVLIVVLPAGLTLLSHSGCSIMNSAGTAPIACPAAPAGPDGEAVDDSFYFLHQALPADGSITAEVTGLSGQRPAGDNGSGGGPVHASGGAGEARPMISSLEPWSKAGIMIKAATTPGSAYAAMLVTGSHGTRMQWNYTGDTAGLPGAVSASSPRWLRLVRSGSTVTGYDSLNGTSWTQVGSYAVHGLPATGTVQAGLLAASPTHFVLSSTGIGTQSGYEGPSNATITAAHVALSGTTPGGSWTGTDIISNPGPGSPANAGPPGTADEWSGSYRQAGQDAFTVTGSGEIAPDVPDGPDGVGASISVALTGMFAALLVAIILGALFLSAEYRRGMVRVTLAAAPSRWRMLAAKSVVLFLVVFAVGLLAAGITLPIGLHSLKAGGNPIDPIPVLTLTRMIAGIAAMLGLCSVVALAIAVMARRAVIAIPMVVVVLFVPYMLATIPGLLTLPAQEWLLRVLPVAAFATEQPYAAYHQVIADYTPVNGYYPLAPLAGLGVLLLWAVAGLAGGYWLLRRRDA